MRSAYERLLDVVNKTAGFQLQVSDVEINNVRENDNTAIARNTRCFLVSRENGRLKGSMNFFYNRLDLSKLFYGQVPVLVLPYGSRVTTQQVAEQLGTTFGIELLGEDVVQTGEIYLTKFPYELELEAQPGSYAVVGSLTVKIVEQGSNVGVAMGVTSLSGLNPPNGDFTKIQGCLYSWNWLAQPDFAAILRNLQIGDAIPTEALPFLKELDELRTWVDSETPAAANIHNAKLVYLGNRDASPDYGSGARQDEIAVIRLSDLSTEVGGELVISLP